MADRSHITSFEAIEAFRASLIVFLGKARPTVEEVSNEMVRMRVWLETDQRNHWQKEIRQLGRHLEQAQQELFAARLSKLQNGSAIQEMAVQRLKRSYRDAEEKAETTRKWGRTLEDRTDPLVKEVESLHSFLLIDMARAVAYLDQVVKTLEAYAATAPSPAGVAGANSSPPAGAPDSGGTEGEPS